MDDYLTMYILLLFSMDEILREFLSELLMLPLSIAKEDNCLGVRLFRLQMMWRFMRGTSPTHTSSGVSGAAVAIQGQHRAVKCAELQDSFIGHLTICSNVIKKGMVKRKTNKIITSKFLLLEKKILKPIRTSRRKGDPKMLQRATGVLPPYLDMRS